MKPVTLQGRYHGIQLHRRRKSIGRRVAEIGLMALLTWTAIAALVRLAWLTS